MTVTINKQADKSSRRDLHQQVTDTIITQLEKGVIPWHQPWKGSSGSIPSLPRNFFSGKKYRGINILLLWTSAIKSQFTSCEWGTFKQWQQKEETIRKGEKGSMIVYYDVLEKEIDGEQKKIPFLKSSFVFNRCQLTSYQPEHPVNEVPLKSLVERIASVENLVERSGAKITHTGDRACYIPSLDEIHMPPEELFQDTTTCTATEGYYSTLLHELTHWTGAKSRLNRQGGKKYGDNAYATEELVAELGAAFLCAEHEINTPEKGDHASYIAHWLQVLKENKSCLITAASDASKAVDYLSRQPA